MKQKILIFTLAVFCSLSVWAQQKKHFNPERFEADLEQYVVSNSSLTQQEQAKFLPLYREMRAKQIELMKQKWACTKNTPSAQIIRKSDEIDLKLKKLQQQYHERFLKALPADKVLKVIQSEERFHRQAFRQSHKEKR